MGKMSISELYRRMKMLESGHIPGAEYDVKTGSRILNKKAAEWLSCTASATLCMLDKKTGADLGWPFNLIADVFAEAEFDPPAGVWEVRGLTGLPWTRDREDGLRHALTSLPAAEEAYIRRHYEAGLNYTETGEPDGNSAEKTRQIIGKALRRLRSPERRRYLTDGYAAALAQVRDAVNPVVCGERNAEPAGTGTVIKPVPLEEMGLRLRTVHSLHRAGLHDSGDIAALKRYACLRSLRNLGESSAAEITSAMRRLGYRTFAGGEEIPDLLQGTGKKNSDTDEKQAETVI